MNAIFGLLFILVGLAVVIFGITSLLYIVALLIHIIPSASSELDKLLDLMSSDTKEEQETGDLK